MRYTLKAIGATQFHQIGPRKEREHAAEVFLAQRFFDFRTSGCFIEVGANDPVKYSQTWQLEQDGWSGIPVEPVPELGDLLREKRPRSRVATVACGSPEQVGTATFHVSRNTQFSSLAGRHVDFNPDYVQSVPVQVMTLDQVIAQHAPGKIDFVSIDVEGMQLDVLRGFDLARHQPDLLLVEDHLIDFRTHRYLRRRGYQLVKRTGLNNWYVPRGRPFALTDARERFALWRKLWLRTPIRALRARLRRWLG
ncbi:MAG: FkbM family methyltransferase [Phycisphaeraceae bacterium]